MTDRQYQVGGQYVSETSATRSYQTPQGYVCETVPGGGGGGGTTAVSPRLGPGMAVALGS